MEAEIGSTLAGMVLLILSLKHKAQCGGKWGPMKAGRMLGKCGSTPRRERTFS